MHDIQTRVFLFHSFMHCIQMCAFLRITRGSGLGGVAWGWSGGGECGRMGMGVGEGVLGGGGGRLCTTGKLIQKFR